VQIDVISRTIVFIVSAITMPLFADVSFEEEYSGVGHGLR